MCVTWCTHVRWPAPLLRWQWGWGWMLLCCSRTLLRGGAWLGACCCGRTCRSVCPKMALELDPVAPETQAGFACTHPRADVHADGTCETRDTQQTAEAPTPADLLSSTASGQAWSPLLSACFLLSTFGPACPGPPFQTELGPLHQGSTLKSHPLSHTCLRESVLSENTDWGSGFVSPPTLIPSGLLPLLVKEVCANAWTTYYSGKTQLSNKRQLSLNFH